MKNTLIVSLDKLSWEEVKSIIKNISQNTLEYKEDILYKFNDLIALLGFEGIKKLVEDFDIRLMLDPKWNDIPNTLRNYFTQLEISGLKNKVDIVTVHANAGTRALKEAINTRGEFGGKYKIFAITALTSLDEDDVQIIYDDNAKHSVLKLTKLALDAWVDGIVCSGQETPMLREVYGTDFEILNPGVRFTGGESHDQKRIVTPKVAIQNGVNHVVMGRPILEAPDMPAAVQQFFTEIKSVHYIPGNNYAFEKMLYAGTWKDILSYIWAFYFRPEWGKYCRFTSWLTSNAYINIWALERYYPVIERATAEMAKQIRAANLKPDIIVGAEMGSIRISLYLAEKLWIDISVYTEKNKFDMSSLKEIDGWEYYKKFGNADVIMELKRHAMSLKWKKIILSEDIVSRGATIKKLRDIISSLWGEVIAIACVWNRYEQDHQDGIPIISCFIPPKFEIYWDEKTREDVRGNFPQLPAWSRVSEKPKNEWDDLVESMR